MKQRQKSRLNSLEKSMAKKRTLPKLPDDKIEFFERILGMTEANKLGLFQYQKSFLLDPAPLKVLRWPRRAGKTTTMAGDDLYFGMHSSNSKIIVTMPKFQQITRSLVLRICEENSIAKV